MIDGRRVIAVTPARGGSKSVPYKNLYPLGGRPLLSWPIDCALKTPEIDRVIVSTDDDRIAAAAREFGAEVYPRPVELATDTALVADTLRHLWAQLRAEGESAGILVLLEATSPLRTPELVARCLHRLVDEELDSIATFHDAEINPERAWRIAAGVPSPFIAGAVPRKSRQQLTPAYQLNGAVYAFFPDRFPPAIPNILFGKMGAEIVPADSVIDIDTLKDFVIANAILQS
jgi:CMP-N,N'-diacetyllegionaminic acid synthase